MHFCSIYINQREKIGGYLYQMAGELWGTAIDECSEREDGTLIVTNDEYANQVNYCPFCGFKAPVQMREIGKREEEMPDLERKESVLLAPLAICTLCKYQFFPFLFGASDGTFTIRYEHMLNLCENTGQIFELYAGSELRAVKRVLKIQT